MGQPDDQRAMTESIETPRLLLRRPLAADAIALRSLFCSEQVKRYLGGALSTQAAQKRVAGLFHTWENPKDGRWGEWVICEKGSDEPLGICSLGWFETEIEVAYMLTPTVWGHGYATEAARACLTYGFEKLQLDRIIGVTQEANRRSQHVLEKVGMHHVGNLRKWDASQRLYELTRAEWLCKQRQLETM
jgi:[ribosomal protein S5]-alanine N-acetyltransferase